MSVTAFLVVAIGGAFGALCRALTTSALTNRVSNRLPFPTLIVNLLSCFAAGCCAALPLQGGMQLLIAVGFLGGYSTLAAMNFEAVTLFAAKRYADCFGYLALTYVTTLGAAAVGFVLVAAL